MSGNAATQGEKTPVQTLRYEKVSTEQSDAKKKGDRARFYFKDGSKSRVQSKDLGVNYAFFSLYLQRHTSMHHAN